MAQRRAERLEECRRRRRLVPRAGEREAEIQAGRQDGRPGERQDGRAGGKVHERRAAREPAALSWERGLDA